MIIHQIQQNGQYGGPLEIPDGSVSIPLWSTRVGPPEIPSGFYAIWNGSGWDLIDANVYQQRQIEDSHQLPQPTPELLQLYDSIVTNTQKRLDDFAKTRNYDSILSACSYLNDPNPRFASDASYCFVKRSETWTRLYTILEDVLAGRRPVPADYWEIEAELPVLEWPV